MSDVTVIESVVLGPAAIIESIVDAPVAVIEVVTRGLQGIPGDAANVFVFHQDSPLALWHFTHGLGRPPIVTLYIAGEMVLADTVADNTTVTITFPTPQVGVLIAG